MKCRHCNSDLERQGKLATGGTLFVCPNCKRYHEGTEEPDLSPNAPTITNEQGGMQSHVPFAFHLLDANATMAIARVFAEGASKYARDNWRLITCEEHINHALTHLFAALAGDKQDEHLEHAGARMIMAIATQKDGSLERRLEYVSKV